MYEVKIYGDIGASNNGYTLEKMQEALSDYSGGDILVRLKTDGGEVNEGLAIYSDLRRLAKENDCKIITRTDGFVASIGTVIFLAGDTRVGSPYIRPFVHEAHMNGQTSEKIEEELAKTNDMVAGFYADHLSIDKEQCVELMKGDTYITPEQCLKIGFCTELEEVPVPLMKIIESKENKSKINIKTKHTMDKKKTRVQRAIDILLGAEKDTIVPQMKVVFTASNEELDFTELEEDATIEVGAKATIGGKQAEGEITSADGKIYVFESGVLTEIKEVEEKPTVEELEKKVQELEAKLSVKETEATQLKEASEKSETLLQAKDNLIAQLKGVGSPSLDEPKKINKKEEETLSKMGMASQSLNNLKY